MATFAPGGTVGSEWALLHPGPTGDGEVLSLNLTLGCVHRCPFCSARAYPTYPGDEVVFLYTDTAERLAKELASRTRRPHAVLISPSTDPFPPVTEIQEETIRVVQVLADHGVESWLMTRGYIRPGILRAFALYRKQVKVTISLTTVNRTLQLILEPLAASPRLRLRQIGQLRELGVPVQVALEPLVPGLTDVRANVVPLLEAVGKAGINHISTSYMFLRPGIRDNLVRALEAHGWADRVLEAFAGGPTIKMGNLRLPAIFPSRGGSGGTPPSWPWRPSWALPCGSAASPTPISSAAPAWIGDGFPAIALSSFLIGSKRQDPAISVCQFLFLTRHACSLLAPPLRVCEKMGAGSGRSLKNTGHLLPRPVPVPIFSQTLSLNTGERRKLHRGCR